MRILSGIFKGRPIEAPKGIRPTQDTVRKSLFDILGDLRGCAVLELCAGSGSVGLEAASRGAAEVVFIENNYHNLAVLRKNIEGLKATGCSLYGQDAQQAVRRLHERGRVFDLVFLDPPYYTDLAKKLLQILGAYDIVAPTGQIIAQHFKKDCMPEKIDGLELFRQNYYGDTVLSFYRRLN